MNDDEKLLKYLKDKYDVTIEDLVWMKDYHRSLSKYGDWVAKTIITSIVLSILAGAGYILIEGVKHIFNIKG
ncbi:hypothetical protein KAR91_47640, partial [Candidatus Pacearchaeota archaeon]|nr:hypothetical protein [Candidatus Pacearchaeota archaeon]